MIYLDYNASSLLRKEVKQYIKENLLEKDFNPSAIYSLGQNAKSLIEEARMNLADFLHIKNNKDYKIIFTSGATEANNLLIFNYNQSNDYILTSRIEHPSISGFIDKNKNPFYRHNIDLIKIDKDFEIDLDDLENKLHKIDKLDKNQNKLISISFANNQSGIIQEMQEISKLAKKYNAKIHSDMTQIIGREDVDICELDLDYVSLSGHKFGALKGSGALIYKNDLARPIKPLFIGGGQEGGIRSGTENLISIASMGFILPIIKKEIESYKTHSSYLRDYLESELQKRFNIKIISQNKKRISNTSLIILPKKTSNSFLVYADMHDIYISPGSSCSSGKITSKEWLKELSYTEDEINRIVRISVGKYTDKTDIDKFLAITEKFLKI